MQYQTSRPYIASYLIIEKGDKIAFVLRSNTTWMNGYYGLPAGKVEIGESLVQTAIHEAKEETGIEVNEEDLEFVHISHRSLKEENNGEWVDVYFKVKDWKGEPHNAEPDLHGELSWFNINELPDNLIPSTKFALAEIQKGRQYSDYGFN